MKIQIIRKKCIACGKCFMIAPDIFDLDDEGIAIIKENTVTDFEGDELLRKAIASCPTRAIEKLPKN